MKAVIVEGSHTNSYFKSALLCKQMIGLLFLELENISNIFHANVFNRKFKLKVKMRSKQKLN